ncbi:LYR motif-containing protein 4 [Phytophthora cinnamomi]|uniref:LYR motif-containing protein 4 n=1 Tax=Phytophthora cinnamomi TaxID=4785 RepID=UPI00355A06BF|nr:LYR motif-containing protein 4 [Phytophthora cinnamomi]
MASSSTVLRLYREMLRNAAKFETYNFRSYATRRVKEDFRKNKTLQAGSPEQEAALAFARQQADVLYRQMAVSKLYPPHVKSVMETLPK